MQPVFVDANVFIYAFLKTKRQLQTNELKMKEAAKKIVARISAGEKVATSVVHFSEVCNILEDYLPFEEAVVLERGLLFRENLLICEVTQEDYLKAISIVEDYHVGINDALAYILMKKEDISAIYSFDRDFDIFTGIRRIIE
ncbi:MAG: type II toxin-antitoxin system VapC family toxin [Candidatus Bathyarchaeota archaeon]|jgi:predicted nucleic acid-binding protein|nr:type II toxin-antitoxin system VapC family toxin [Candidatus Bathyarchaeota archaeon]